MYRCVAILIKSASVLSALSAISLNSLYCVSVSLTHTCIGFLSLFFAILLKFLFVFLYIVTKFNFFVNISLTFIDISDILYMILYDIKKY